MSANADSQSMGPCEELLEIRTLDCSGAFWNLHHYSIAGSTNDVARGLEPWSAVRADVQTKGRGRFGRAFASGSGGLWISAVLPKLGDQGAGFSLRVGASLLDYIKNLGLSQARLRWPNDLMCGNQKLGGLLIEQTAGGSLIVGFGLNIFNEPWSGDVSLQGITTSLAVLMDQPPSIEHATTGVLAALAEAHQKMISTGMAGAIEELNRGWVDPMPVEIHLSDGEIGAGFFVGLDPQGNLILRDDAGEEFCVQHHLVERLRELIP